MNLKSLVSECNKQIDQKWNLASLNNFEEIQQLSSNNFGELSVVQQKSSDQTYALKQISFERLSNYNQSKIIEQLQQLINLQQPKLIKFYGYNIDLKQKSISYLLELMDFNLEQYCSQNNELKEEIVINIFDELVNILNELKKQAIVHGNLKPENIFLNKNNEIKIADIGNAKFTEDQKTLMAETLMFAAPEVSQLFSNEFDLERILMSGQQIFTHATDVFSLGLITLRITGGIVAKFQIRNLIFNCSKNNIEKLTADYIQTVPEQIRLIVSKMLSFDAQDRPTIEEIFDNLQEKKQIEIEEPRQYITQQSSANIVMDQPKQQKNTFCNAGCNCYIF